MPVDPTNLSPADFQRWERAGWLRTLVGAFREQGNTLAQYDPDHDCDPNATAEMLRECEALAAELEAELQKPPTEADIKEALDYGKTVDQHLPH